MTSNDRKLMHHADQCMWLLDQFKTLAMHGYVDQESADGVDDCRRIMEAEAVRQQNQRNPEAAISVFQNVETTLQKIIDDLVPKQTRQ